VKKLLLYFLCFFLIAPLWAVDFGLVLDLTPGAGDYGAGGKFDFSGILIPRLSIPLGDTGEVFISAGARVDYQNEAWSVIPELLRTEFSMRFNDMELKLGRTQYADPLGFIADGLFDGARISLDTAEFGSFSLGAWYTGLLSKNRIKITMTSEEFASFYTEMDYSNFADTYFAPSRMIASLAWEHPGLWEIVRAKAAFISQSDLGDSGLHSQYLAVKFTAPAKAFVFDLGGCLELIENGGETGLGMAGEIGVSCNLSNRIEDRLSFTGRFSSGTLEDSVVTTFLPITTASQGDVLKAKLSGLSMLSLDYLARLHETLSAGISSSYFIRSDLATYQNYGSEGYWLGDELFGRLIWSPVSDVQINLGGGVFLPALGDVSPKSSPLWRAEINVILALY
jgi:hypothetical protein